MTRPNPCGFDYKYAQSILAHLNAHIPDRVLRKGVARNDEASTNRGSCSIGSMADHLAALRRYHAAVADRI
jgi:hypothetical protein